MIAPAIQARVTAASNQMPDIKARVEQAIERVKLNETTFLGVLDEDTTSCYAGLVQKPSIGLGADANERPPRYCAGSGPNCPTWCSSRCRSPTRPRT